MIAKEVFYQRSDCVGSRHFDVKVGGKPMRRLKESTGDGSGMDNQVLPEEVIVELVKAVERVAAEDPGYLVGFSLKRGRIAVDLIPVLLSLYQNGIAVQSVTASKRAFFLELGKIDKKELERAAMDYASEFINERLSGK
jgi:hypothetical protein